MGAVAAKVGEESNYTVYISVTVLLFKKGVTCLLRAKPFMRNGT
jgi:hypothetical protein